MQYNPQIHHRKSIRLKEYDYSQAGLYFITICCQNRKCLFGNITVGAGPRACPQIKLNNARQMKLNNAGQMINQIWNEIPSFYNGFNIHEFIVMPNHIHGIIEIVKPVGAGPRACPNNEQSINEQSINEQSINEQSINEQNVKPSNMQNVKQINMQNGQQINGNNGQQINGNNGHPQVVAPTGLSDIIKRFKTLTTKRYIDGVKTHGWQRFDGKLWQRNYWEHIVRDENEYQRISKYIINNPIKWNMDKLNNDETPGDKSAYLCESSPQYNNEAWMV